MNEDNIKPKISCCDLSYAAGLIDGEGCITLAIYRKGVYRNANITTVCVHVRVSMADAICPVFLYEKFGGKLLKLKPQKSHFKECLRWEVSGKAAYVFLDLIIPFLKLKKDQAIDALSFKKVLHLRGRFKKIGPHDEQNRWDIINRMRARTTKGPKPLPPIKYLIPENNEKDLFGGVINE